MITLSFPTYSFAYIETTASAKEESVKTNQAERKESRKLGLDSVKNEYKRTLLTRISDHLVTIQDRHINRLGEAVEKLNELHNRLSMKVEKLQEEGVDVATALAALETSQTSIDAAETAVATQKAKDYSLDITSESTAQSQVATLVQAAKEDMKKTAETIRKAKMDLVAAVKVVNQLKKNTP